MSIRVCACYHVSGVACFNVCVYVCGILPDKWRLIKNLLLQLYFCIHSIGYQLWFKNGFVLSFIKSTALKYYEFFLVDWGYVCHVSTTEELLGRNSSGCSLEIREYGRIDPSRWIRGTIYLQKLALTSPTSTGRLVRIVGSRTQATEFVLASSKKALNRKFQSLTASKF
jgi:hypothetical protein